MIAYSNEHHPPAPALQVTVSSVVNRRLRRVLPAILDTGADVTAIPHVCFSSLKLYPTGAIQLEGIEANKNAVFLYAVRFTIAEITIPRHEVVLTPYDFVLLGRDILNQFNLHLYGPRLTFEIDI